MVAYGTVDDVAALIPRLPLTAGSIPTRADIDGFLTRLSGEVDSAIGSRNVLIPLPAATPQWFLDDLANLVSMGAAALALYAAFPSPTGRASAGEQANRLWTTYQTRLTQLRQGVGIPGVIIVASTARDVPHSFITDNQALGINATLDEFYDLILAEPRFREGRRY